MPEAAVPPIPLPRRALLALAATLASPAARASGAEAVLADEPVLLVAGPAEGRLAQWGQRLSTALPPGLPAGTRIQPSLTQYSSTLSFSCPLKRMPMPRSSSSAL